MWINEFVHGLIENETPVLRYSCLRGRNGQLVFLFAFSKQISILFFLQRGKGGLHGRVFAY